MPRRTVSPPKASDTFLWRICKALDEPPRMLAHNIGVDFSELRPLLDERWRVAEIDRDEVWWKIAEYTDRRIGEMLAIRVEVQRALQRDRSARAKRIAAMAARDKKGSPRDR